MTKSRKRPDLFKCRTDRGGCGGRFTRDHFDVKQVLQSGKIIYWSTCKDCYKDTEGYKREMVLRAKRKEKQKNKAPIHSIQYEYQAANLGLFNQLMRNM